MKGQELVPIERGAVLAVKEKELPALVTRAGAAAVFAAEEFLSGKIRNPHTRKAYERAVRKFLEWCEQTPHNPAVALVRFERSTPPLIHWPIHHATGGSKSLEAGPAAT